MTLIDAADISEWLSQAATANGHGSPYLRGDTEFDRDVDITDFNTVGLLTSVPQGKNHTAGCGMKAISTATVISTLPISIFWPPILLHPAMPRRPYPNRARCFWRGSP